MATNMLYKYTENATREWPVASGTVAGQPVISANNQPGVTLTSRGDATKTVTSGGNFSQTFPSGGIGNRSDSATVATDGTFIFPVTGASSATPKNTQVYITGSAPTQTLTLTVASNVKYGVTDDYPGQGTAGATAVKIGVFA